MLRHHLALALTAMTSLFCGTYLCAAHLWIYDFDQTITKRHTFAQTASGLSDDRDVSDNIKELASEALQTAFENGDEVAIATFHTRPDVIRHYLRALLPREFADRVRLAYRDGVQFPLNEMSSKNRYIEFLIDEVLKSKKWLSGVTFYDDSKPNIEAFIRDFVAEGYSVEACLVSDQPDDSRHFEHTLLKIDRLNRALLRPLQRMDDASPTTLLWAKSSDHLRSNDESMLSLALDEELVLPSTTGTMAAARRPVNIRTWQSPLGKGRFPRY